MKKYVRGVDFALIIALKTFCVCPTLEIPKDIIWWRFAVQTSAKSAIPVKPIARI
jgi:hypothetical protein